MLSKCIGNGYQVQLLLQFSMECFDRIKMCMWFGYNTLIVFSHFFCLVNLVLIFLFLFEMLSKCIDSGYLVGATPLTVFHHCFETVQMLSALDEDVHVVWV